MIQRTHTEKRLLEELGALRPADAVLARCEDPERCARLYRGILVRAALTIERGAVTMEALLGEALHRVPDPERALVHLDRFLEASLSPSGLLEHFLRAPRLLSDFLFLISSSHWLADALVREVGLFRWLLGSDILDQATTRAALLAAARGAMRRFDRADLRANALRRFQRRELLRIAASDLLGRKSFPQVVAELSALADAIVTCVFEEATAIVERRRSRAISARITIIALGKLGGGELNYSSDIDLMIVYAPSTAGESAHDDVIATVKEMLRLLTESSAEGVLYRTDLRLRPDGAAGALALSLDATMTYYERRGAAWERQMLLRARVCAGDGELGAEFLQRIEPFVHPRSMLRPPSQLLAGIHSRLAERRSDERNVKHMRGGIRHIEFSLQALQMLHGQNRALRTPSTTASLAALAAERLLEAEEEALLRDAYVFLRRVEHVLQLERFEQTHTLPEKDADLLRVAWTLGFTSIETFRRRLTLVRGTVDRICGGILRAGKNTDGSEFTALPAVFAGDEQARRLVHDIVEGRGDSAHSGSDRRRLAQLLPDLLADVEETGLPLQALRGIEQFIHSAAYSGGMAFLEHRQSRQLLLRLATLAPVALRSLERDPLALELVFSGWDESRLEAPRLQLVASISALAALLLGDSSMPRYGATLTHIADTVLRRALAQRQDGSFSFAVLALGKYGSAELIPGSDLDVILLFSADENSEHEHTTHEQAQRLARDLIADLRGGVIPPLYEVDARLRPEGRNAPLAVTFDSWQRYLDERASLWERQSLLRARIAAGDPALGARIMSVINRQRRARVLTREDIAAVRSMRLKMEPENRFRQPDFIDIKKSAGGLVDAEFAAQLLQLAFPALPAGATTDILVTAKDQLPGIAEAAAQLREQYVFLRRLQLFLRLLADTPSNLLPQEEETRRRLAAAIQAGSASELLESLRAGMTQARRNFAIILDAVSSTISS